MDIIISFHWKIVIKVIFLAIAECVLPMKRHNGDSKMRFWRKLSCKSNTDINTIIITEEKQEHFNCVITSEYFHWINNF